MIIWQSIVLFISVAGLISGCLVRESNGIPWKELGGEDDEITHIPYHIQLEFNADGRGTRWAETCAGAIYNKNIAVTVAHCAIHMSGLLERARVRSPGSIVGEGKIHEVVHIEVHPNAVDGDKTEPQSDIALIEVKPPFEFNKRCEPIEIADHEPSIGETGIAGGYGERLDDEKKKYHIKTGKVKIIDRKICQDKYRNVQSTIVNEDFLCVAFPNSTKNHRDSCIEESGAPLAIDKKLVGLASIDKSCEKFGYPGLYVNVATFRDWIEEKAAHDSSSKQDD